MEPDHRRILAQGDSETRSRGWFTRGELPSELVEGAARRLGGLGLLTAVTCVAFGLIHTPIHTQNPSLNTAHKVLFPLVGVSSIVLSLRIYFLSRRKEAEPRKLLDLGVAYLIAMAFLIGWMSHFVPWKNMDTAVGSWSGVAAWIIIFSVVVPSTPRRTLWASSIAALADPLTLLSTLALGNPMPPATAWAPLFGPTLVALLTAVVAARINYRMGKQIHDAQEMGSYHLIERLGQGGMGEVWRAEHKMLARPAAIKLIRPDALAGSRGESGEQMIRRFQREAQATAQLESEHTIELYDFGAATDGSFYYVMELLDGLDMEVLVKRFGPLPPERAVFLLLQVCESLAEAHESGLIHRDIKPSNIYVCRRALKHDVIKVLDFGLVKPTSAWAGDETKLTGEGSIQGTPAYMVPEIIEGAKQVDGRADLYALGCVAYWLLSGKLVFEAKSAMKMVVSHASATPPRLSERAEQEIPPALEQVVHACLEKDPARRPGSAQDLAARLASVALEEAWSQERAAAWWQDHAGQRASDEEIDPTGPTAAL
jgi:serine/threonine-protein kinase